MFDPKYKKSCRQTYTNERILELKNKIIDNLKKTLDKTDYVSITTDAWISL